MTPRQMQAATEPKAATTIRQTVHGHPSIETVLHMGYCGNKGGAEHSEGRPGRLRCSRIDYLMIEFFSPILEHLCPLFVLDAQMGLFLPRWASFLPRVPPPTPVLYSSVT